MTLLLLLIKTLILIGFCLLISKTILDGFYEKKFMQRWAKQRKDPKTKKYRTQTQYVTRKKQPIFYWVQMTFMFAVLLGLLMFLAPDVSDGWSDYFDG